MDSLYTLHKALIIQSLRSHIKNPKKRCTQVSVNLLELCIGLAGVNACSSDSSFLQAIDLVLHQSQEGRDDEGDTWHIRFPLTLSPVQFGKGDSWNLAVDPV